MNVRMPFIISLIVMAAMVGFAFLTEARLPEGAQLPTHFNASGEADDWAPALTALLMPVGILLATTIIFSIIPAIEPLQNRLEGSAPVLKASWIGLILISVAVQAVVGLPAWGIEVGINAIVVGVGLMLILLGNVLPKSRPGFFVGIRTPWAIIDTDNWIATHRLGGKLFMAAGAAIIIAVFVGVSSEALATLVMVATLGAAFVPFIYSWWFWKSRKKA